MDPNNRLQNYYFSIQMDDFKISNLFISNVTFQFGTFKL